MRKIHPNPVRALAALALVLALSGGTLAQTRGGGNSPGGGPGDNGPGGHGVPIWPHHGAGGPAACGAAPMLANPNIFLDPDEAVIAISRQTQAYIRICHCDTPQCVAEALDRYAAALAVVAPRLNPQLRDLPNIVAHAAARAHMATSNAEAAHVLRQAAAEVHQRIALLKADDPDRRRLETRGGDVVANTITVAALSLERASGI